MIIKCNYCGGAFNHDLKEKGIVKCPNCGNIVDGQYIKEILDKKKAELREIQKENQDKYKSYEMRENQKLKEQLALAKHGNRMNFWKSMLLPFAIVGAIMAGVFGLMNINSKPSKSYQSSTKPTAIELVEGTLGDRLENGNWAVEITSITPFDNIQKYPEISVGNNKKEGFQQAAIHIIVQNIQKYDKTFSRNDIIALQDGFQLDTTDFYNSESILNKYFKDGYKEQGIRDNAFSKFYNYKDLAPDSKYQGDVFYYIDKSEPEISVKVDQNMIFTFANPYYEESGQQYDG